MMNAKYSGFGYLKNDDFSYQYAGAEAGTVSRSNVYLQCPDPRLKMVHNVSKQKKGWVRKKAKAGVVCELLPGLLLRKVRQSVGNAATSLTRFCFPSVGGRSAESVTTHGLYAPQDMVRLPSSRS